MLDELLDILAHPDESSAVGTKENFTCASAPRNRSRQRKSSFANPNPLRQVRRSRGLRGCIWRGLSPPC